MKKDSLAVRLLYGTTPGRALLKLILKNHMDRLAVDFLCSRFSRPVVGWYARRHGIALTPEQRKSFHSFRDFFIRRKGTVEIDLEPEHLISPCDGWLSAYPIGPDSSFLIKGSRYRLSDLVRDEELAAEFQEGSCLVFRLCASDYHHYCYIDDGYQGKNHYIPGELHSVQPIACEAYPVYTLNRRCWTLMATRRFGPVIQTEIGALVVGGIANERETVRIFRGQEMGHFELAGSTIVLLFQKERVCLRPAIAETLGSGEEFRVTLGMWIGETKRGANQADGGIIK